MGAAAPGALNAQGFSQAISSNQLPDHTHITHSGIFNENFFQVGDKAKNLLEIHHGLAISNCDLYDLPNRNYFLSLFIKSSTDGQKRTNPLNLVIALDVSGSMNGPLKYSLGDGHPGPERCRTALAKKAILMLFDKLKGEDVFSLVIFHNQSRTIIDSAFVKDLKKQTVERLVNAKFESGGTTVASGFQEAKKNIQNFRKNHAMKNYEHRIVMLTDVCDNSVAGEENLIREISEAGISTTIIGVSTDFRSQTCQKLIKVRGFNYMCAVEEQDLQTYLVDQFDYTFFPCVQDVTIKVQSESIEAIEVFGSVDHDVSYPVQGHSFTVTKMKSGFPSDLILNKQGKLETKGGLILVQFRPKEEEGLPKIVAKIAAHYSDLEGKEFTQLYNIDSSIEAEEYYSHEAIKKGVSLFYYTQTIRSILKDMKQGKNVLSDSNKGFYLGKIDKLKEICPASKLDELQSLRNVVQEHQFPKAL